MLRSLTFALAIALTGMAVTPAFAQDAAAQPAPANATQQTPDQIVKSIADQLAKAIDGHQQELKNNPEKLIAIINGIFLPHFAVDYASILVLGMHAREATPDQRERFAKAFYNSITHRYAQGLLDYTRGRVKVLPSDGSLNNQRTVVRTQVLLDNGKTVSVDYAFRKDQSGEWKAYDVIIEGISYITNYRNQVDAEIRKEGLDRLITSLETQGDQALKQMDQDSKANGGT